AMLSDLSLRAVSNSLPSTTLFRSRPAGAEQLADQARGQLRRAAPGLLGEPVQADEPQPVPLDRRERPGVGAGELGEARRDAVEQDRKSTRLNSSHVKISYAVFYLK